jgi:hypothetical protein
MPSPVQGRQRPGAARATPIIRYDRLARKNFVQAAARVRRDER